MFSSNSCIVSVLTLICLCFWANFCVSHKVQCQAHSFACGYPVVSIQFVEKKWSLPLLNCLGSLVKKKKINSHRCMVYFWTINYIPLIFMSLSHCFDFCNKFWNHEVWLLQLCSFSRLFWIFWFPCNSICTLKSACQFLQK